MIGAQKLMIGWIRAKLNMMAVLSPRWAASSAMKLFVRPFRKSKKKEPEIFKSAERLHCKVEGFQVVVYRWNQNAGKRILILHGFESRAFNFEHYVRPLIAGGYEVVAFDAPGHGASSGKILSLPLYLKTISTINSFYGPFNAYICHSFGGLALTHFLEQGHHDSTTRLVLIAPATETTTAINSFFRFLQLGKKVRIRFDEYIYKMAGEWPAHFSLTRTMPQINAQTLWIHDEDDELTPLQDALRVQDLQLPNVTFYITQGLGHRNVYRDSLVRSKIIEFLTT